jgi:hypothetical protein
MVISAQALFYQRGHGDAAPCFYHDGMVARIGLKGAKPVKTYFREWREWKGWTLEELADRMETTAATVSRVESGTRDWGKGYLEAFSHVIGCPHDIDPIRRPPGAALTLDDMLRNATPEQRKQVLAVVITLLSTGTE